MDRRGRCAALALCLAGWTAGPLAADEFIVVSGGPALQKFERSKNPPHDVFWGNFVESAAVQLGAIKGKARPGDKVTWLVYRPGYVRRQSEEGKDMLGVIQSKADALGVSLFWFDSSEHFVNYINRGNNRTAHPIAQLDFFGHSNKVNWMFDYSNELDGSSTVFFHTRDFATLDRAAFRRDAECTSWGCHSGEYYADKFHKVTGVKMWGAIGKTDYSGGGLPVTSSFNGRWVTQD